MYVENHNNRIISELLKKNLRSSRGHWIRTCSLRSSDFFKRFRKKHGYCEKQKKDVSGAAVELHSEIFMRSSIEGIRGFCKAKPQDSNFIKMLSRVIQSMRSGSPFFVFQFLHRLIQKLGINIPIS